MAAGDVKLALIGYGKIAPKHLEVFRALGASFVAAVNRSEGGRERARTEGGIPRAYGAIGEMIDRERPDGIVCCASYPQIHAVARELIPTRVPLLLEKPPGTSASEHADLVELTRKHGTLVQIALNRRHYSVLRRALEEAGSELSSVLVEWSEDPSHMLQRFTREEVARIMFANSLHGLDLLTTIAGALPSPHIHTQNLGDPFRWIMSATGTSDRGIHTTFWSTWDAPGKWRVSFSTRGKRFVLAPLESCTVSERGKNDRPIEPSEEDRRFKPGFYDQARAFLQMIETRRPNEHELASAGPAMALAEALTNAALGSR